MCTRAVGALAHFLEDEGLPTVQISLIREHTEKIKPPRALWVPFELGRPLGVPGNAAFQTEVLRSTLALLEAPSGPVLADFPKDAPTAADAPVVLACPVNFPAPVKDLTDTERLQQTFQNEIAELRSWYDLAVAQRGRTTATVSGLSPEAMGTFISDFLTDNIPDSPRDDLSALDVLKLAVEDLKAYYYEAVSAQPGQQNTASTALTDWFWHQTAAGKVMFTLQDRNKHRDESSWQIFSKLLLIPHAYHSASPYQEAS
jgi:hypothetical protein